MKSQKKQRQETGEMGTLEGAAAGGGGDQKGTDFRVAVEEEVRI